MKTMFAISLCILLSSCSGDPKTEAETKDEDAPKFIPGLTAVDVHGNFTNKDFSLKKDIGAESSTWTCDKVEGDKVYTVKVWGKGPTDIHSVDATATYLEATPEVKQFIGYCASIPYDGSNSTAATQWATSHFESGGDTLIGTVRFQVIAATTTARTLKLNAH